MKTIISILVSILSIFVLAFNNVDNSVCPTPAKINVENSWQVDNIYSISIENGYYIYNNCPILLNDDLDILIHSIHENDNVSYPSEIAIEVKFYEEDNLYVANLLDTYLL